jgi:pSer/pThr/pTyr-binding forkhead associated (FHA) protein
MAIICNTCGYENNPDNSEFCDACGAEVGTATAPITTPLSSSPPIPNPVVNIPPPGVETVLQSPTVNVTVPPTTPIISIPQPNINVSPATTARLISKQANAPVPQFSIDSNALIGIFDPDGGPVDIDLENFSGGETVSRNHAEIYPEGGGWKVKDLGSTNGVFIKTVGQSRFGARITAPTFLNPGDEVAIAKICFVFQSP